MVAGLRERMDRLVLPTDSNNLMHGIYIRYIHHICIKVDASSNLEPLNVHCENLLCFKILRNYNHGSNDAAS